MLKGVGIVRNVGAHSEFRGVTVSSIGGLEETVESQKMTAVDWDRNKQAHASA